MIATLKIENDVYHINPTPAPIENFEVVAVNALKRAGHRITLPRTQVIHILAESTTALSAYEIHEKIIQSKGKIDIVSVYRVLSLLQENDLVSKIGIANGFYPNRNPKVSSKETLFVVESANAKIHQMDLTEVEIDSIKNVVELMGFQASEIRIEVLATPL